MTLKHQRIKLRKLIPEDKKDLAQLANNKKIFDNVRDFFPFPYTEKDAIEFINTCKKEDPPCTFAIEYRQELAGVIGLLLQSDVYRKSAEIGYWLGEPFWNKGIATEAVKLMTDYTFNTLKMVRIYTGVFDFNKASQRVLEKCGYKLEGIFEKSIFKNNKICNEYRYARIID